MTLKYIFKIVRRNLFLYNTKHKLHKTFIFFTKTSWILMCLCTKYGKFMSNRIGYIELFLCFNITFIPELLNASITISKIC